ncbi:GIY-YIG nuclease family protein [Pseudomonadota bacterium]
MNCVYILKSKNADWHYVGQTNNLEKRLKRHNSGQVPSTKNKRPFEVIHVEEYETRKEAMDRESYLKSRKGYNNYKNVLKK